MSRYKEDIVTNMENKENIRNICVVSHVDHGKTTLSDHLLQAGGLVSRTMAGSARALDYLEEEQQRGITIKTANISFIFKQNNDSYLINLVDTPGHVDFSGMVSQALRLVDGVIIVVDAVEGVMAQTESVIRQAMNECLKPILFINKIDRLITELKLEKEQIETRLGNIIQFVNELIEQYVDEKWKKSWKVNFDNGTIIIGSALYGWGISKYSSSVPKFDKIIQKYKEKKIDEIKKEYPIISALMPVIINTTPSPVTSQEYRITNITEKISSKIYENVKRCDNNGILTLSVGKLMYESNRGIIAITRVFSGTIKSGMKIKNIRMENMYRIHQVALYKGQTLIAVEQVTAGNIAVLIGLKDTLIGDTLSEEKISDKDIKFKQISYLQESVISRRIEPLKIGDIPKLKERLEILSLVKPNFNYIVDKDTGEIKIFGIGELQLEIIIGEIKKAGIEVEVSEPEVTLAEQIEEEISISEMDSVEAIEIELTCKPTEECLDNNLFSDTRNNCLQISKTITSDELQDLLITGFRNAIYRGPVKQQQIRNLTVVVRKINEIVDNSIRYEIIVPAMKKIIHRALVKANVDVYEPIYNIQVTTPVHYLGQVLAVLQRSGCVIEDTKHLTSRTFIEGKISVEESLKIANELRSASEGYAFWQFKLAKYKKKQHFKK